MSRLIRILPAALTAGCLCVATLADLFAETSPKPKTKGTVRPVQADEDEPESERPPARPRPRSRLNTESEPAEPAGPRERPKRPVEAPLLRVEKLDPQLEQILKDWERHTAGIETLTGPFSRFKYQKTFPTEYRADGKFAYQAPDRGNYEIRGMEIKKGDVSKKKDQDGVPFRLESDTPERWVSTGKEVIRIDEKKRTYEMAPIPPEDQGQNMIDGPLPFLFGMKADRAKRRYKLELLDKTNDKQVYLLVKPRERRDSVNWREATVIIDRTTFLPEAVMLTDPTGETVTVHRFRDLKVNGKLKGFFEGDPFKPDLRKLKLVLNDKTAEPATFEDFPASGKDRPVTGGTRNRGAAADRSDRELPRSADASSDTGAPRRKPAVTTKK